MGVSKNRGTPKWMVCNGKPENPIKMDDDLGVPLFSETPIYCIYVNLMSCISHCFVEMIGCLCTLRCTVWTPFAWVLHEIRALSNGDEPQTQYLGTRWDVDLQPKLAEEAKPIRKKNIAQQHNQRNDHMIYLNSSGWSHVNSLTLNSLNWSVIVVLQISQRQRILYQVS